jgi:hypothetical protein
MDCNFVRVREKKRCGGNSRIPEPTDSQWELIRAAILEALLPYQEARNAVAKAILSVCDGKY